MPKEPTTKTTETPAASLNLHQRIRAVMMDVRRLQKDKQVGSGDYSYKAMSEEKVTSVVRNAMIDHGLTLIPVAQVHAMHDYQRLDRNGKTTIVSLSTVDVTYKLTNVDNPAEFETVCSSGTGVDPQDKGVGKAMTYAYKYAMLRAFAIPTGADPDDVHNDDLAAAQAAAAATPPAAFALTAADNARILAATNHDRVKQKGNGRDIDAAARNIPQREAFNGYMGKVEKANAEYQYAQLEAEPA